MCKHHGLEVSILIRGGRPPKGRTRVWLTEEYTALEEIIPLFSTRLPSYFLSFYMFLATVPYCTPPIETMITAPPSPPQTPSPPSVPYVFFCIICLQTVYLMVNFDAIKIQRHCRVKIFQKSAYYFISVLMLLCGGG